MKRKWDRHEILQLLVLSGTLAGLSITGLTIFSKDNRIMLSVTIADDMLAFVALIFLLATYLFFFSLRTANQNLAIKLEAVGDILFLLALTGMVATGFIILYTIW